MARKDHRTIGRSNPGMHRRDGAIQRNQSDGCSQLEHIRVDEYVGQDSQESLVRSSGDSRRLKRLDLRLAESPDLAQHVGRSNFNFPASLASSACFADVTITHRPWETAL